MNKSGDAVRQIKDLRLKIKDKKKEIENLVIIHDDLDIPFGKYKLSFNKSSGGHKGVESVKRSIGTWDFWRVRMGIQRKKRIPAEELVLKKLTPEEEKIAEKLFKHISDGIKVAFTDGFDKAMSLYNK